MITRESERARVLARPNFPTVHWVKKAEAMNPMALATKMVDTVE